MSTPAAMPDADPAPAPKGAGPEEDRRPSALRRAWSSGTRARVGIVVAVAALAAVALTIATLVASSPATCGACHEMRPWVASWQVSPHAKTDCWSCHAPARPWYGAPVAVVERWGVLAGDLSAHIGGVDTIRVVATSSPDAVPDSRCLECHPLSRVATGALGLKIDHRRHAAQTGSCVTCHRWTAHPPPKGVRGIAFMAVCFACHGMDKGAKAPGRCSLCHAEGFDLRPLTHKPGSWRTAHGAAAQADPGSCTLCHTAASCRECHGIEMPHPAGWSHQPSEHGVVASQETTVCVRCHTAASGFCARCHKGANTHHRGPRAPGDPFVAEKPVTMKSRDIAVCAKCHEKAFCATCHMDGLDRVWPPDR